MAIPCEDSEPQQSRGGAAALRRAAALGSPQPPPLPRNLAYACLTVPTWLRGHLSWPLLI